MFVFLENVYMRPEKDNGVLYSVDSGASLCTTVFSLSEFNSNFAKQSVQFSAVFARAVSRSMTQHDYLIFVLFLCPL